MTPTRKCVIRRVMQRFEAAKLAWRTDAPYAPRIAKLASRLVALPQRAVHMTNNHRDVLTRVSSLPLELRRHIYGLALSRYGILHLTEDEIMRWAPTFHRVNMPRSFIPRMLSDLKASR